MPFSDNIDAYLRDFGIIIAKVKFLNFLTQTQSHCIWVKFGGQKSPKSFSNFVKSFTMIFLIIAPKVLNRLAFFEYIFLDGYLLLVS